MSAALERAEALGVRLLSEDQTQLARAFAGGPPADRRFSEGDWDFNSWGAPVLEGAAANLSAIVEQRLDHSTHSLLIASFRQIRLAPDAHPLVCAHGVFTGLSRPDAPAAS